MTIPVIDLFAGPGGLGEGFSSFASSKSKLPFKLALSVEMEKRAHETLELRAFYRQFNRGAPKEYYNYLNSPSQENRDHLFNKHKNQAGAAQNEARCLTLGSDKDNSEVSRLIEKGVGQKSKWVLVGGPPCQAYSLVGRSRRKNDPRFKHDHRHTLYEEYLRILAKHSPPVFIMENVKGILTSQNKGVNVFKKILSDLSDPQESLNEKIQGHINQRYKIYSLVERTDKCQSSFFETPSQLPSSFIVKCEKYGIPQARHRVILLGIRSDLKVTPDFIKEQSAQVPMWDVLSNLPIMRSRISKGTDSFRNWKKSIQEITKSSWFKEATNKNIKRNIREAIRKLDTLMASQENKYVPFKGKESLAEWFNDRRLLSFSNHEPRGHIIEDLHRYFYAACYAKAMNVSPYLKDFPIDLLPKHKNAKEAIRGSMFNDRFRVQVESKPSTTITSHISKDGHYYIHPDPVQCRSLTVREAARLQTFPDNYFFEGPRTSQYVQVGNAVPPYMAKQIAGIVFNVLRKLK